MRQPSSQFSSPGDSDEELLEQARAAPEGDLRAFEELVRRYQKQIIANCRYITQDPNNAEDLAQDVLVKAFFGLAGFQGSCSFRNWLLRIKINHCLNHLKTRAGRSYVGIEETDVDKFDQLKVQATAAEVAGEISDRTLISEVLGAMSATVRIPLVLCDMDELSYEEVARALGIGLSAAKMRIKRGRQEFRERYQGVQRPGFPKM